MEKLKSISPFGEVTHNKIVLSFFILHHFISLICDGPVSREFVSPESIFEKGAASQPFRAADPKSIFSMFQMVMSKKDGLFWPKFRRIAGPPPI